MWCAVHVKSGRESQMETFVSKLLSEDIGTQCFHLTRYRRKKYGGKWQTVQENILPGYVFITTDKPEQIHRKLKTAEKPGILWGDDEYVATLDGREADLMERITDNKKPGEIALSQIVVEKDGEIRVLSGPLLQVEDMVKKFDFHKRVAEIETDFMGQKKVLYLVIEFE